MSQQTSNYLLSSLTVREPEVSGIRKRVNRQNTQEVCPFNSRFAEETDEPGYAARGPGELPTGVEPLPGEEAVEPGGTPATPEAEAAGDVSAETPGVGNPVHPGTRAPSLVELMRMTRDHWDAFSRGSAIRRAGYAGFKRNVAVAMGNWLAGMQDEPPEEAVAVLRAALEDDEPLVREHAAWALERISGEKDPSEPGRAWTRPD